MRQRALQSKSRGVNPKYTGDVRDPFEREKATKEIIPTSEQERKELLAVVDALEKSRNLGADEKKALVVWKTNLVADGIADHVKKKFTADFWAWLLGRGTPQDVQRTSWGRQSLADDKEVRAYVDLFVDKNIDFRVKMQILSMRRPVGINQCYLYFKYIVRNHNGDHNPMDVEFLNDWEQFGKDFDTARELGQQWQKPGGAPHEMAPYNSYRRNGQGIDDRTAEVLAAEKAAKEFIPPGFRGKKTKKPPSADDEDDETESSSDDMEESSSSDEPPPPPPGPAVPADVAQNITQSLDRLATDMGKWMLEMKGSSMVSGMHGQYAAETNAKIAALQTKAEADQRVYEAKMQELQREVEAAKLAKQPEPKTEKIEPPPDRSAEIALLQQNLKVAEDFAKEIVAKDEARDKQLAATLTQNTAALNAMAGQTTTGFAQLTEVLGKASESLKAIDQKMDQKTEAYTNNFLSADAMTKELEASRAQLKELEIARQKAVAERERDSLANLQLAQELQQKQLDLKVHQETIAALKQAKEGDFSNLRKQLTEEFQKSQKKQLKMKMEARNKLIEIVDQYETKAPKSQFKDNMAILRKNLQTMTSGMEPKEAMRMQAEIAGTYEQGLLTLGREERAARVADAALVSQALKQSGEDAAAILRNQGQNLSHTAVEALVTVVNKSQAEAAANNAIAQNKALEIEKRRLEQDKEVAEEDLQVVTESLEMTGANLTKTQQDLAAKAADVAWLAEQNARINKVAQDVSDQATRDFEQQKQVYLAQLAQQDAQFNAWVAEVEKDLEEARRENELMGSYIQQQQQPPQAMDVDDSNINNNNNVPTPPPTVSPEAAKKEAAMKQKLAARFLKLGGILRDTGMPMPQFDSKWTLQELREQVEILKSQHQKMQQAKFAEANGVTPPVEKSEAGKRSRDDNQPAADDASKKALVADDGNKTPPLSPSSRAPKADLSSDRQLALVEPTTKKKGKK